MHAPASQPRVHTAAPAGRVWGSPRATMCGRAGPPRGERGSGGLAGGREVFGWQGQGGVMLRTLAPRLYPTTEDTRARARQGRLARGRAAARVPRRGEGGREGGRGREARWWWLVVVAKVWISGRTVDVVGPFALFREPPFGGHLRCGERVELDFKLTANLGEPVSWHLIRHECSNSSKEARFDRVFVRTTRASEGGRPGQPGSGKQVSVTPSKAPRSATRGAHVLRLLMGVRERWPSQTHSSALRHAQARNDHTQPIQRMTRAACQPFKTRQRIPRKAHRGHTDQKGPGAFQDASRLHVELSESPTATTSHSHRKRESRAGPEGLPGTQKCSTTRPRTEQLHAPHPEGATDSLPTFQAYDKDSTRGHKSQEGPEAFQDTTLLHSETPEGTRARTTPRTLPTRLFHLHVHPAEGNRDQQANILRQNTDRSSTPSTRRTPGPGRTGDTPCRQLTTARVPWAHYSQEGPENRP